MRQQMSFSYLKSHGFAYGLAASSSPSASWLLVWAMYKQSKFTPLLRGTTCITPCDAGGGKNYMRRLEPWTWGWHHPCFGELEQPQIQIQISRIQKTSVLWAISESITFHKDTDKMSSPTEAQQGFSSKPQVTWDCMQQKEEIFKNDLAIEFTGNKHDVTSGAHFYKQRWNTMHEGLCRWW